MIIIICTENIPLSFSHSYYARVMHFSSAFHIIKAFKNDNYNEHAMAH